MGKFFIACELYVNKDARKKGRKKEKRLGFAMVILRSLPIDKLEHSPHKNILTSNTNYKFKAFTELSSGSIIH